MTILAKSLIKKTKKIKFKKSKLPSKLSSGPTSTSTSASKLNKGSKTLNKGSKLKKETKLNFNKKTPDEQWPIPRNIFFRPERMKYVKKIDLPKACVFCTSANEKLNLETLCVYKSKSSQIILNKYPYNNGHLLVLPLNHCGDLMKLNSEAYIDLQETLRLGIQAIQEIYNPQGLNIGMNHGKASGAGIPDHIHYHLVPRWSGDLNFFPLIAETKIVIESIESSYKKFKNYFNKLR